MSGFNNFEHGVQYDGDYITLTADDGTELECAVDALFPVNDNDYIALIPVGSENEGIFLGRFKHDVDNGFSIESIDDDNEFQLVSDAYDALMADEED